MSDNLSIQEAIRGWRDKLLQLDRRNNRVYFKFKSAVEIQNLSVSDIGKWVASKYSAAYRFEYVESAPAEGDEDRGLPVHLIQQRQNAGYQEESPELRRRLSNLYKKNRLWEEEQGVSVLYLAVGFLEWVDERGETAHAPLVLIPCKLKRRATREPFILTGRDDPEMNETLRHMLSKNYGVELPDLTELSVADVLNTARQAVEGRGWSIRERIVLHYFYSSKLAMYNDLERMSEEDEHHPLIRSLANPTKAAKQEPQETEAGASLYDSDLAGGKLDDLLPLRDQYAILDADYSQLLTIDSAMKGKHLVVYGPPGTGKSQTIANLIATYLANGKRVLFVSEKKAALDVVKRKLVDCGLGVFCLDLHSGAGKKEVYGQLRESLDTMSSPPTTSDPAGYTYEDLKQHRDSLNKYVRELHEERKPLVISLFDAIGRFEQARGAPEMSLKWSGIDAKQLKEIERLAGNLAQRGDNFRAHHANRRLWSALKQDVLPFDAAEKIQARLQTLMEAVDSPRQTLSDLADWAGVPIPTTAEECRQTAALLDLLSRGEGVPERWLNHNTLLSLRQTAGTRMKAQTQRRELEKQLRQIFSGSIPDLDYAAISRQLQSIRDESNTLKAFIGVQWETGVMENSDAQLKQLDEANDAFAGVIKTSSAFGNALGMRIDSPPDLAESLEWTDRIKSLYPALPSWLDDVNLRQTAKARMAGQKERRELKEQLEQIFSANIPDPDLDYADISRQLQDVQDGAEALEAFFAGRWGTDVMGNPGALLEQLDDAIDAFADIIEAASILGNALGMRIDSPPDLAEALEWADRIKQLYPAPLSWLDNAADETNRSDCERWKGDLENHMRERKRLLETYDERIVDEVNPAMLGRYRRGCRSFWQRFGREWRDDQRLLNSLQTSPDKLPRDARLRYLKYALNVQDGRNEWLQDDSPNSRRLRERFPDFKPSSFEHTAETLAPFTADFEKTVQLRDNWNENQTLLCSLLTDQRAHDNLKKAADEALEAKKRLNKALKSIKRTDLIKTSDAFAQTAEQAMAARPVLETLTDSAVSEFISACKITPVCFRELVKWVENAARFRELEEEEKHEHESLQDAFGKHYQGSDTDWQAALDALETLQRFKDDFEKTVDLWDNWNASISLLHSLLTDQQAHDDLKEAEGEALDAKERLNEALESIGRTDLIETFDAFAQTKGQVDAVRSLLEKLTGGAVSDVIDTCKSPPRSFSKLVELVGDSARLREFEQKEKEENKRLQSDFGERYQDPDADWQEVLNALQWTEDALNLAPDRLSPRLTQHFEDPAGADEYRSSAESIRKAGGAVSSACAALDNYFDIQEIPWKTWDTAPFDKLRSWAEEPHENADCIQEYLEYEKDARSLETIIGVGVLDRIRYATNDAKLILGIIRRAIYRGWIDRWSRAVPELGEFSRISHEGLIDEFRRLDKLQMQAAQSAVQATSFENYERREWPEKIYEQYNLLSKQCVKKKGQMSARQLLKRIPDLLGKLKPCMLMSPLAVSQYLPRGPYDPDKLLFDAVIFDEASQVLPEDAVPAIARATQTIVVGDEKQLPPTSFFRRSPDDEEPDYDDENYKEDAMAGTESVLSVMIGMVGREVEERRLNVHYRSRHEDLIRFSNHVFYAEEGKNKKNRLLTFPAPRIRLNGEEAARQENDGAKDLGVRSVYLPDARYDAGGTSTNPDEAEKVVEIVFDLMRTRPDHESVGVVALSSKQADEIERRIERHRLENRDLDARFDEERHDRFFVKNLENVQGDERDHIILCVGYGPTKGSGAVPNRFGPINLEGGERRLNVAVSRARRQTIVVHSLRPGDIRADNATHEGPRLLKRYLEYIRNPRRAFESEITDNRVGEPESPFEEEVKRALEAKGHLVDSQIGVSGYRIDLGIRSEDGSGYVLGVECDGWTYHSSPAARDRDRQRQDVLEGLGWKIHRVWSTAWAKNRERELEAIESALEQ